MHGRARSHARAGLWIFVALRLLGSGVLLAQPASPDEGPAARQFASWLALFNKGDRAALEAYHRQSFAYLVAPPELGNIERELSMSLETGGLDIRKREWGSATQFSAVLSDRATHQFARATMRVEAAAPHRVLEFALVPIATPAEYQVPEGPLDAKRRRALIDAAARAIEANYVFPDVGRRMASALRERDARGDYEHISDCTAFAARLTDDLRALCHDKHLRVTYKDGLQLPPSGGGGQGLGFGEIERFRGNIVRISIGGFPPVRRARDAIAAFMSDVADADALIIDLRANHGGDPSTVTLVASYLFDDQPVHLNDVIERDGTARTFWTQPSVAGKRFGGKKPVYVLTSAETFSGGEELAYDLQSLHRATLIGETSPVPSPALGLKDYVLPPEVMLDVALALADFTITGEPALGWRVRQRFPFNARRLDLSYVFNFNFGSSRPPPRARGPPAADDLNGCLRAAIVTRRAPPPYEGEVERMAVRPRGS